MELLALLIYLQSMAYMTDITLRGDENRCVDYTKEYSHSSYVL